MNRAAFVRCSAAIMSAALFARRAGAQQSVAIKVGVGQTQDVASILNAVKSGSFSRAGLDVELVTLVNGAAISAAVVGGSLQLGMSSLQGLISGHVRGIPFMMIAPEAIYTPEVPYGYLFVRKDAPFVSARDLNGKIFASPALKDLDWIVNATWMEKNGGDFRTVKSVELPNPSLLPALVEGRTDAYSVGEPWSTFAQDSGKVRIFARSFEAVAPRFLMTSWFSTSDYISQNRAVVDRFVRVMHESAVYFNAHKADMVPMLAAQLKLEPSLIARTMNFSSGEYLEPALIQPMIDAAARYGIIDQAFPATDMISPAALRRGR
jgi:NitT/TauT family transport system substrate-binding protein